MSGLTAFEQRIVDAIKDFGWFALSVAPRTDSDDPQEWFTYTIGLNQSHGWPELICFGLDSQTAREILADAIAECEAKDTTPVAGLRLSDTIEGRDALLINADDIPDDYFGTAIWYSRWASTPPPLLRLQLVWPDIDGHFPTNPACEADVVAAQSPLEKSH